MLSAFGSVLGVKGWRRSNWLRRGPMRGMLSLVLGTAGAQGIGIFSLPLLTRLYGPESFGSFAYVSSLVIIVSSIASLKLEWGVPLPKDLDTARALTRMALCLSAVVAGLVLLAVLGFQDRFEMLLGAGSLPWMMWLPPLVLLTSWFSILSQAALRERAYGSVASRTFAQAIGIALGQLGMAVVTRGPGGLLAGLMFGRAIGIWPMARMLRPLLARPAAGTYALAVRRYWRFPVVFAPSALLNNLGTQLPLVLVTLWYGTDDAGYLGAAQRIVLVPSALLGVAAGQVFSGELTARMRQGTVLNRGPYLAASRRLAVISGPMFVVLVSLSGLLVPVLLGAEWVSAGAYAQAMCFSVSMGFIASPLSYVFVAYQKTALSLLIDISRILLVGGAALLSRSFGLNAVQTVWAMSLSQFVNYLLTWLVGLAIVSRHDGRHSGAGLEPSES